MKYFSLMILFILFSCGNKEAVLLPKSNVSLVKNVQDHSPIYIFFRTKANDTLAEVNRKNSIISTNWILNVDKRLPLRLVIPKIMKLQEKKREEKAHKNEAAQNYYSYADSVGKNLAFIAFTNVYYKTEKPKIGDFILFTKNNEIKVNKEFVRKEQLKKYLAALAVDNPNDYIFCFEKEMSFGSYIQHKIFMESLSEKKNSSEEFVY
jgi:hypothetical protein